MQSSHNGNGTLRYMLLMVFIGIIGCKEAPKEKKTLAIEEKKAVVKVVLNDLNDKPINLEQYKGRTVFINFWATWCKPCIQEMPFIKTAQDILGKDGVVFLLASNESFDQINEFKKDHDYDFNFVRLVNMDELNLQGLPTTYIFNPKGELVFSEIGYRKWDDSTNIEMILQINSQK